MKINQTKLSQKVIYYSTWKNNNAAAVLTQLVEIC
jgi:hypothetical protein